MVQKVSNLIINLNIYLRDVKTGTMIAAASADMRGNTDESWSRTMSYLIRNRLLAPNYGVPAAVALRLYPFSRSACQCRWSPMNVEMK